MIKLIGLKRIVFLAALLGLNILAAVGYFTWLVPLREDTQGQLNALSGQITELQGKISTLEADMASLKLNLPKYEELEKRGFLQDQDHFEVGRILETIRRKVGLSSFSFEIAPQEELANADATALDKRLISSRIKISNISAGQDADVYILLQEIANSFPEYTRLRGVNVTQKEAVTDESLKKIAKGQPVAFVGASISFDWVTLMPKVVEATPPTAPAEFRGR